MESLNPASAGVNRIFVSPEHDRWIDGEGYDEFIRRVLASVEE